METEEEDESTSGSDSKSTSKRVKETKEEGEELSKLEKRRKKVAQASRVLRAKRKLEFENLKNETQKLKLENQKLIRDVARLKTNQGEDSLEKSNIATTISSQFPNVISELGMTSKAILTLMTHIRDRKTTGADYVRYSNRVCRILAEEGLAVISPSIRVTTPTNKEYAGFQFPLFAKECCAVSIMRAGDVLCDAIREIIPEIPIGKVLIQRQEHTAEKTPSLVWSKFPPDIFRRFIFITDPMLATGGTIISCIKELIKFNVPPTNILFLNIISCPEGLQRLAQEFPQVRVITCSIDPGLDSSKYIIPGLGDFGDRYFHTVL
jgi:uracil phosphoribosyltransferase